jgi:hypothetical protein
LTDITIDRVAKVTQSSQVKKTGRNDLADVESHVEPAVQVNTKVSYTVDRLNVDAIHVDTHFG